MSNQDFKNMVIVGDKDCGKFLMLSSFLQHSYNEHLTDSWKREGSFVCVSMDGKNRDLDVYIRYIAGSSSDKLKREFFTGADVILMCFSIDRQQSLHSIADKWRPQIKRICPLATVLIVGNKADLRNDEDTLNHVAPEEAQVMAKRIGAYSYMECSAWSYTGVQEVFSAAVLATER